jgi:hypothetical protein
VVDRDGLENRFPLKRDVGSNPTLSANESLYKNILFNSKIRYLLFGVWYRVVIRERCQRGRTSALGKRVYRQNRYRGFESHPLRQFIKRGRARWGASGSL